MLSKSAYLFALIVGVFYSVKSYPNVIRIGAVFEYGDDVLEMAFKSAVDKINAERKILPRNSLMAQIERIKKGDSFQASKKVCGLIEQGVVAIVGPQSMETATHIQSICSTLNIPHIEARLDYRVNRPQHSLNLYPPSKVFGDALRSLIKSKKWRKFAIIYKENDGLLRMEELLKSSDFRQRRIFVRQLENDEYRIIFKDLARNQIKNVVLDAPINIVFDILNHAKSVNMLSEYHDFIITSLDLQNIDLEEFVSAGTNISSFSLIDQISEGYLSFMQQLSVSSSSSHQIHLEGDDQSTSEQIFVHNFTTEAALYYDTVKLLAKGLHDLSRNYQFNLPRVKCSTGEPWPFGANLTDYIKKLKVDGISGNIQFDKDGQRTDVKLDIYQLKYEGLKLVGNWTVDNGTIFMSNYSEAMLEKTKKTLENKTLTISTILSRPYMMLKPVCELENITEITNDCYHGFCVDLIKNLADALGFKFEIKIVRDKAYGEPDEMGEWNGMIGELIDGKADIAIADLTINHEREKAVDFTMPFMNLGIGILFRKMKKEPPSLFSFMAPLAVEVWLYLLTAFLAITLAQFLVARFSPYEWMNPHPCIRNPHELENNFTIKNTLWFTIGCLMQQGCYVMPRALSTRVLAASWWFFILILVSSYTANLAAFLTNERMSDPIESVEALAKQTKIHYGCLASGSTKKFFKNSSFSTYARMWSFMESARPSVFVESNAKGVERVKRGNYAFLMESTSIEYVVERECDLYQVGSLLDNKGYGIATQPSSPYRKPLSETITKLQENGTLFKLKEKWWNEKKCPKDSANKAAGAASELGLLNVGGVFMVLAFGAFMSCLIAVGEFCWKMKQIPREERDHIFVELMRELRNVTCCYGRARPVRRIAMDCNGKVVVAGENDANFAPMMILRYGYPHPLHPIPSQGFHKPDLGANSDVDDPGYHWRRKVN